MLSIAFWNTNKKVGPELIAQLQRTTDADIVIVAECDISTGRVLLALNEDTPHQSYFRELFIAKQRVRGFTRLSSSLVTVSMEQGHYFAWHLRIPNSAPLLLFAVHLRSKLYADQNDQAFFARSFVNDLRNEEQKHGHENTIVIGDFNMTPFEEGVAAFDGLHAVMDRRIADRGSRVLSGKSATYFYNPMWSLMGDASRGPPGTYYYQGGKLVDHYWYMFDQALLRPSLLRLFNDEDLQILTNIGGVSLLNEKGAIGDVSDHLPLWIRIEPEETGNGKPLENS